MAKCVWASAKEEVVEQHLAKEEVVEHICNIQEQNAKAWLSTVVSSLSKEESRRTMVTLRALWHAKRKAVYENIFQEPIIDTQFRRKIYC